MPRVVSNSGDSDTDSQTDKAVEKLTVTATNEIKRLASYGWRYEFIAKKHGISIRDTELIAKHTSVED